MTLFTIEFQGYDYDVGLTCGRPSSVVKRKRYASIGTEVEFDELPFLLQASIENKINTVFDHTPASLFLRGNKPS